MIFKMMTDEQAEAWLEDNDAPGTPDPEDAPAPVIQTVPECIPPLDDSEPIPF